MERDEDPDDDLNEEDIEEFLRTAMAKNKEPPQLHKIHTVIPSGATRSGLNADMEDMMDEEDEDDEDSEDESGEFDMMSAKQTILHGLMRLADAKA
jgi:hypothetical protein